MLVQRQSKYSACFQHAMHGFYLSFYTKTIGYFEVILRLLGIKIFFLVSICISIIPEIENPQLEPDVSLQEAKRKRVETKNYKSKRRKPNEYSENTNEKPKELEKAHNSTGITLDSSKSLYSKTRRKKQTAVSTTYEVETEAVEDSDVLIIDDDKASTSEISSVPGKLVFIFFLNLSLTLSQYLLVANPNNIYV